MIYTLKSDVYKPIDVIFSKRIGKQRIDTTREDTSFLYLFGNHSPAYVHLIIEKELVLELHEVTECSI